jgi:hypothetical protein
MPVSDPSAFLIFRQWTFQYHVGKNMWFCYINWLHIFSCVPSLLSVEEVILFSVSLSANNFYTDNTDIKIYFDNR